MKPQTPYPRAPAAAAAILAALLAALAALPYLRVRGHEFLAYDDMAYVAMNAKVRDGLTPEGLRWAFTSFSRHNWHPLTWISHMLDVSLFGLDPGAHHLVNLGWHAANTALLFLALRALTGALLPSAAVAALFGVHPLHAESVAWVAERKDLLSGFFFAAALLAYARHVRRPGAARFAQLAGLFALGLLAKPMLVSLPLVLLLLDLWPLGRLRASRPLPLLLEKTPLFALSAASSAVTYLAQEGALVGLERLSLPARIGNALVSYAGYLGRLLWPASLSPAYPHPGSVPAVQLAAASAALVLLSAAVAVRARRRPYLAVGWLWYLAMLLPVIGIVQVGAQAMADRYSYLPSIGVLIAAVWLSRDLAPAGWRRGAGLPRAAAVVALAALALQAHRQAGHWRNGVALFEHALAVNAENARAHVNLGAEFGRRGRHGEAVGHFRAALRIAPLDAEAHRNLGLALTALGRHREARESLRRALELQPGDRLSAGLLRHVEALLTQADGTPGGARTPGGRP